MALRNLQNTLFFLKKYNCFRKIHVKQFNRYEQFCDRCAFSFYVNKTRFSCSITSLHDIYLDRLSQHLLANLTLNWDICSLSNQSSEE